MEGTTRILKLKACLGGMQGWLSEKQIQEKSRFQPEIVISHLGYKRITYETTKTTLNYLDIPLMFAFKLPHGFSFNAGLVPSILIYGRYHIPGFPASSTRKDLFPINLFAAAGIRWDVKRFGIGARYNLGVLPVINGIWSPMMTGQAYVSYNLKN